MCMFLLFVIFCVSPQIRAYGDFETTTEFYDGEPEVNKNCYEGDDKFKEGILGQIEQFPWIGVLKVHFHAQGDFRVGATGVVLIKNKYSIANANDIANIPNGVLKEDSQVMFIPEGSRPWYCKVKEYLNHPEFQAFTLNTISLLELEEIDGSPFAVKQICWPSLNLNTANELYGIGYTDEHAVMEKILHKLQFIPKEICREFYNRSNLLQPDMQEPARYHCAFAPRLKKPCAWENGMVVASNASGVWMLVGIMVHGPGCSTPARFLDFSQFAPWIDVTTSYDEVDGRRRWDYEISRRSLSVLPTKLTNY